MSTGKAHRAAAVTGILNGCERIADAEFVDFDTPISTASTSTWFKLELNWKLFIVS